VNDVSQACVGDRKNCGIDAAAHSIENTVEARQVDRLSSNFDEVSSAAKDAQDPAVDFSKIIRDEPSVDFRVAETLFGDVAAEERRSAK